MKADGILHDSFATESPVLVLQSLRHVPVIQCNERLHTFMNMNMHVYKWHINVTEYIWNKVLPNVNVTEYIWNKVLPNASKWFSNTILEQLVDEIIVISDPLFIDSSVSWRSFWKHLMEIRESMITENPLLIHLRVLIHELTGKYARPGNRKTIEIHSHVF